jgi:hypothetical protein
MKLTKFKFNKKHPHKINWILDKAKNKINIRIIQ